MAEQYDIIIITVTARQKLVNQHVFNQKFHIKIKANYMKLSSFRGDWEIMTFI